MDSEDSNALTQEDKRRHVGPYVVGKTLGQGAFGKVKLGTDIFTGEQVAIKIISYKNIKTKREKNQIERERNILLQINHPNIVNLKKVVEDPKRDKCYMIFEYVSGGELFDYIVSHGRLSENEARKFIRQIVSALEYCHSHLIIHRDLKPENLLLDKDLNIKISDFGLSNIMEPGKKFSTFCGSLHYACPEILRGEEYLGPGVDVWSMGIILYCLVVGRQPWDGSNAAEIINAILDEGIEVPQGISEDCINLILSMLRVSEDDRISIPKIRYHKWILEGCDGPPESYLPPSDPITTIDEKIFNNLTLMGFVENAEEATKELLSNEKTQLVVTYNLLLQKKQEEELKRKERKEKERKRRENQEDKRLKSNANKLLFKENEGHGRSHSVSSGLSTIRKKQKKSIVVTSKNSPRLEKHSNRPSRSKEKNKEKEDKEKDKNKEKEDKEKDKNKEKEDKQKDKNKEKEDKEKDKEIDNKDSKDKEKDKEIDNDKDKEKQKDKEKKTPKKHRSPIDRVSSSRTRSTSLTPNTSPPKYDDNSSDEVQKKSPSSEKKHKERVGRQTSHSNAPKPTASTIDNAGKLTPTPNANKKRKRTSLMTNNRRPSILAANLFGSEPTVPVIDKEEKINSPSNDTDPNILKRTNPKLTVNDTTTIKSTDTIVAELLRVFEKIGLKYKKLKDKHVYQCTTQMDGERVRFEVEIVSVKKTDSRAVVVKRIEGGVWPYKQVYEKFVHELSL